LTHRCELSKEEAGMRVSFFLKVIFLSAIVSNFLWIAIAPQSNVVGSSGLVYASQGVVMGVALLNGVRVVELSKLNKREKGWSMINLIIFGFMFIQILIQPQVFLNVGPGVASSVHAFSFYGALLLFTFWSIIKQSSKQLNFPYF
jgi:membrane associated rhomboid family serine protease